MDTGSLLAHPTTPAITLVAFLLLSPIADASEAEPWMRDPLPARIGDFALKVEPGVALPLASPQSRLFKTGGGQTIKALWVVNEHIDVGPSASFLTLPADPPGHEAGAAWTFGESLRIRRKRNAAQMLMAISPWGDADVLYVRTGERNRGHSRRRGSVGPHWVTINAQTVDAPKRDAEIAEATVAPEPPAPPRVSHFEWVHHSSRLDRSLSPTLLPCDSFGLHALHCWPNSC